MNQPLETSASPPALSTTGHILALAIGLFSAIICQLLGSVLAVIGVLLTELLVTILYLIGLFLPLEALSTAQTFLQNNQETVLTILIYGLALTGGLLVYAVARFVLGRYFRRNP